MRFLIAIRLIFLSSNIALVAQNNQSKPNVIIFFTDDQGYQDVGCFGSPLIKTSNLDKMAVEGMRFTDFYSISRICSPLRTLLLTGAYPPRVNVPIILWLQSDRALTTIDHLTGCEVSEQMDVKNIWPLLSGVKKAKSPHKKDGFYYYSKDTAEALRIGFWKLHTVKDEVELYNLKTDISETTNIAENNFRIVESYVKS